MKYWIVRLVGRSNWLRIVFSGRFWYQQCWTSGFCYQRISCQLCDALSVFSDALDFTMRHCTAPLFYASFTTGSWRHSSRGRTSVIMQHNTPYRLYWTFRHSTTAWVVFDISGPKAGINWVPACALSWDDSAVRTYTKTFDTKSEIRPPFSGPTFPQIWSLMQPHSLRFA